MPPWVGPESDEYRAVCVYSDAPGLPQCLEPATLHVAVDCDQFGLVGLETCGQHAPIAKAAGRYVAEHLHAGFCGLPGTRWTDDRCVLDDSGQEPAHQCEVADLVSSGLIEQR